MKLRSLLHHLFRLFFGLTTPGKDRVESLNLGLFDFIPILRRLASSIFFRRIKPYLPPREHPTHIFCVGRSGSGKSEVLKLLALADKTIPTWRGRKIHRQRSLVLIDPHGDLASELARQGPFHHDFKYHPDDPDLICIDPCLASHSGTYPSLNPFDLYGHKHAEQERDKAVQQLTAVLRTLTCKTDESLSTNMETLLYPCLSVLLARPHSTLFDLLRFVDSTGNDDLIELGHQSPNPAHRFFFHHSFNHHRFAPTRGAISTKIQSLLNSQIFASFLARPHSTINLEKALSQGKTIILNCATSKLGNQTMSAIGRFMVGMVLSVAFNREQSLRYRRPIRLIIDEMQHFVSDELTTILTEARKYGLHLTLACQIVGQGMSTQLSRIILGNTALKLLGDAGTSSRRAMADEMGIPLAETNALGVGEFLLRHHNQPPARIRFTNAHVGSHHHMKPAQWQSLKRDQIKRWYTLISSSDPPDPTNNTPLLPNTLDDFDSSPPPP